MRSALSLLTRLAALRSTVLSPKSMMRPPRMLSLTLFSTLSVLPLACSDALSAFSIRWRIADSSGADEVTVTVRRPLWAEVRVKKSVRTAGVRGRRALDERTLRRLVVICAEDDYWNTDARKRERGRSSRASARRVDDKRGQADRQRDTKCTRHKAQFRGKGR